MSEYDGFSRKEEHRRSIRRKPSPSNLKLPQAMEIPESLVNCGQESLKVEKQVFEMKRDYNIYSLKKSREDSVLLDDSTKALMKIQKQINNIELNSVHCNEMSIYDVQKFNLGDFNVNDNFSNHDEAIGYFSRGNDIRSSVQNSNFTLKKNHQIRPSATVTRTTSDTKQIELIRNLRKRNDQVQKMV
jgi:hypothetical protein